MKRSRSDDAFADTRVVSGSEQETSKFAEELAQSLRIPAHVLLFGELGTGKTTFARGLAEGLGIDDVDEVRSPTFAIINQYKGRVTIYHIDLYRVEPDGIDGFGLEEIFDDSRAAVIVEWAERLGDFDTPGATCVFLTYVDEQTRKIDVCNHGNVIDGTGHESPNGLK